MNQDNVFEMVFSSKKLVDFLTGLEMRYTIEDAQEKYHKLVNFSQNAVVPYHQWFKYREGFAAELIQELISMAGVKAGEAVIDPFCGSGTTNVVAAAEGFDTLGLDVNPMSAFITNAKTQQYSEQDLQKTLELLHQLRKFKGSVVKPHYNDIRKYFNANNFAALIKVKTFIDSVEESPSKTLLTVAFLSCIEASSDRKRDGNGLKTIPSRISDPEQLFVEKVNLIVSDIRKNGLPAVKGFGVYNSAFCLVDEYIKNCSEITPGAIIFSPPYANSFDYFESYKLELVFGDYALGMKGLGALRKKAVRSFIGAEAQIECDEYVDIIAQEIEADIPKKEQETGKKDLRTRKVPNMLRGYFADMHEVIRQCSLCLPAGKFTYIVVDQSAYLGKIVPTDLLLAYYGELEGFEVTRIINCRNARTSTQQLNKYPYLKTSLRESIVCLKKK